MVRITVVGGTGYAGGHIVRQAHARGHVVTVLSRTTGADPVDGVVYRTGSVLEPEVLATVADDADVVVSALSPRGAMAGLVRPSVQRLADVTGSAGIRLGVIGGAGSLRTSPTGPLLVDSDGFPDAAKPEAREMGAILGDLTQSDPGLDWFFVSPAAEFGARSPGTPTGHYRVGDNVLLVDDAGRSRISGEDFGMAVVDEIEHPQHHRRRFTVAS